MHALMNILVAVQILSALIMIGLVLIQHGKGADMGASFGSGSSGSLFGATGSANFLSRSTAVCAAIFFCCTLALAYSSSTRPAEPGSTVLDRAGAAPAPASGAMVIPPSTSSDALAPTAPDAAPAASGAVIPGK